MPTAELACATPSMPLLAVGITLLVVLMAVLISLPVLYFVRLSKYNDTPYELDPDWHANYMGLKPDTKADTKPDTKAPWHTTKFPRGR